MISSLKQRLASSLSGSSLKAQLVRGALGMGGLNLLSLPLTLITSILLARGLGPEGFGQYVFALSVISILALPLGPGLGQFVTREVAKYHQQQDWALLKGLLRSAHQWLILGSTVMILIIALLVAGNANWAVGDRWTLIFLASALLPLLGLNALRGATLRGLRHVIKANIPEMLVRPGLHLVVVGTMLVVGILNPATALFSQIVATALAFSVGAWFLQKLKPTNMDLVHPNYRYGDWSRALLPFTLLASIGTLNNEIGILALGWLSNNEDVATIRVAMSGAILVVMPHTIVTMVNGPHITRAYGENDKVRLQSLSRRSDRAALLAALIIALPLIFLGGPIIEVLYGEEYRQTVPLSLAVLVIGQLITVTFGSAGIFLTMCGFERHTLIGQLVALFINIIVALLLIPEMGAVGAALSIAIGLATRNAILVLIFVKKLGLRPSIF